MVGEIDPVVLACQVDELRREVRALLALVKAQQEANEELQAKIKALSPTTTKYYPEVIDDD